MADTDLKNPATGLRSIEVYYTPVQNKDYRSVVAYRAFARINDEKLGVLLPQTYLPVIEDTAVADSFSMYMIERVVADIAKANKKQLPLDWFSAPVAVRTLLREGFADKVAELVAEYGIPPELLCIEFDMRVMYEETSQTAPVIAALRELGVLTLIRDFGSELCPTQRLCVIKPDMVTIPQKIVRSLASEDLCVRAMSESVFSAAASQDISIIAEGVDTPDDLVLSAPMCCLYHGSLAGRRKKFTSIR